MPHELSQQPHFNQRATDVALMALDECRTSLMMAFRYLDRALFKLPIEVAPINAPLATDGKKLFFNPNAVLLRYRTSPDELARDPLHAILRCIFGTSCGLNRSVQTKFGEPLQIKRLA